jgi:ParB family chromosome partitioning protein
MSKILLSKIVVTSNNPRKTFDESAVQRLGQSILEHGQIHPILVRPLPDGNYELITGEMRLRGCMSVGLPEIDAEIRELTDLQCAELRLIENV